jgi:hypothetical protein
MNISIFTYIFACFTLLSFSDYALAGGKEGPQKADIGYQGTEHGDFNKIVLSADAKGEEWTADPVLVSLKFIGPSAGMTQTIERTYDNPESPKAAQVTITNEKLLDDSIMAVRHKLVLNKHENGSWVIESSGKAIKCWEGRGHANYSKEPCD